MGTWGMYPHQSDSAMHLFGEIYDAVNTRLEYLMIRKGDKAPESEHIDPYDFAGVVVKLLQMGMMVKYKYVSHAQDCIRNEMKRTKKAESGETDWNYPEEAIKLMHSLIIDLQDLMNQTMSTHVKQWNEGTIWDNSKRKRVKTSGHYLSKRGIEILGNTEICQLKENRLKTIPRGDLVGEIILKFYNDATVGITVDYEPLPNITMIELIKRLRDGAKIIPDTNNDQELTMFLAQMGAEHLTGVKHTKEDIDEIAEKYPQLIDAENLKQILKEQKQSKKTPVSRRKPDILDKK